MCTYPFSKHVFIDAETHIVITPPVSFPDSTGFKLQAINKICPRYSLSESCFVIYFHLFYKGQPISDIFRAIPDFHSSTLSETLF